MARTFLDVRHKCPCHTSVLRLTVSDDADNEFTQLMKGLQGERLRQAFKFLDKDQDGYIRPEQFKKIVLVCATTAGSNFAHRCYRNQLTSLH